METMRKRDDRVQHGPTDYDNSAAPPKEMKRPSLLSSLIEAALRAASQCRLAHSLDCHPFAETIVEKVTSCNYCVGGNKFC